MSPAGSGSGPVREGSAGGTAGTSGSSPSGPSPWHWRAFRTLPHSIARGLPVGAGAGSPGSSARHFGHRGAWGLAFGTAAASIAQHPSGPQQHPRVLPVTGQPHGRAGWFPPVTTGTPKAVAHCARTSNAPSAGRARRRSRRPRRRRLARMADAWEGAGDWCSAVRVAPQEVSSAAKGGEFEDGVSRGSNPAVRETFRSSHHRVRRVHDSRSAEGPGRGCGRRALPTGRRDGLRDLRGIVTGGPSHAAGTRYGARSSRTAGGSGSPAARLHGQSFSPDPSTRVRSIW